MVRNTYLSLLLVGVLVRAGGLSFAAAAEFVEKPTVTRQGDGVVITFTTSAATDAAVAILGPDERVVCHLAAGLLGEKASWPFQKSLAQRIEWDGKTDLGRPAPAGCRARVSLGLGATYAWTAPLLGGKEEAKPLSDIGTLSAEELALWPRLLGPGGERLLVPSSRSPGTGILRAEIDRKQHRSGQRYQVAVDCRREEVYVSGGQVCFNGVWRRLDGKTGKWDKDFQVSAGELAVSPENGLLYLRDMKPKKKYNNDWRTHFLRRCDRSGKPVPFTVPIADEDGEILLPSDSSAKNFGDGMAFSPNGDLYMLCEQKRWPEGEGLRGRIGPALFIFDAAGNPKPPRRFEYGGVQKPIRILDESGKETADPGWHVHVTGGSCGVGADRHGNFYIGTTLKPIGKIFAEDLVGSPGLPTFDASTDIRKIEADKFYKMFTGSIIKFSREGARVTRAGEPTHRCWGNAAQMREVRVEGAQWTYVGLSPLVMQMMSCVCHQSRFTVDGFGRAYVPQLHRQSVLVLDPAGQPFLRIGRYVRGDAKAPGIRFGSPTFLGVSDTALYVADKALGRVLKANLTYEVEETVALP